MVTLTCNAIRKNGVEDGIQDIITVENKEDYLNIIMDVISIDFKSIKDNRKYDRVEYYYYNNDDFEDGKYIIYHCNKKAELEEYIDRALENIEYNYSNENLCIDFDIEDLSNWIEEINSIKYDYDWNGIDISDIDISINIENRTINFIYDSSKKFN